MVGASGAVADDLEADGVGEAPALEEDVELGGGGGVEGLVVGLVEGRAAEEGDEVEELRMRDGSTGT